MERKGSENRLPDHEYREESSVGAGVMSTGGTAEERGSSQAGPSSEDLSREPGEVLADRDARDRTTDIVTPADLFGGDAENDGIEDADSLDEDELQAQARPQL